MNLNIILASGGTGGHLFPAIALSEVLRNRGYKTTLITDHRGKKYVTRNSFDSVWLAPVQRKNRFFGKIFYPLSLIWQFLRCIYFLFKNKPQIVVGFGGYPSLAPMLAAQFLRIPTILHEQNAILGRANRVLQKRANIITISIPNTKWVNKNHMVIGNPVRSEILKTQDIPYTVPSAEGSINILVIGGSQGAKIFSQVVPNALKKLPQNLQKRLIVNQQCRAELLELTQDIYKNVPFTVVLKPFFDNIYELLIKSHLVICRAGASTVAELTISRRPSILVPLAISLDGDQMANAMYLKQADAAWIILERQFTEESLSNLLDDIFSDSQKLKNVSNNLSSLAKSDAAIVLANLVSKVILSLDK